MGIYAVASAFERAQVLGDHHAAARLLLWMARCCRDASDEYTEAGLYFGGQELSAQGLGYMPDEARSVKAKSAVKRAVQELLEAGLVERVRTGGHGRTAAFRLNVSLRPVDNSPQEAGLGTGDRPRRGPLTGPPRGPLTGPVGDRSPVPLERRPGVRDMDQERASTREAS